MALLRSNLSRVGTREGRPRQRTRRGLAATWLLMFTLIAVVPSVAQAVEAKRDFFGVSTAGQLGEPQEVIEIERMGLHNVRNNVGWDIRAPYSCASPEPATVMPDFSILDRKFREAALHNVTIIADFYGLGGIGCNRHQFPMYGTALYTGYLSFVRWAVQRYGYQGDFWRESYWLEHPWQPIHPVRVWEVWNEPNWTINNPGGTIINPQAYAKFLIDVANKIRVTQAERQSLTTTNTKVLMGGLSQFRRDVLAPTEYLETMYRVTGNNYGPGELRSAFDGVSYHPYRTAGGPTEVEAEIRSARSAVEVFGDPSKTLWLTEIGWPTFSTSDSPPTTISEPQQAENLRATFRWIYERADELKIKHAAWFAYQDYTEEKIPAAIRTPEGLVRCDRWSCWNGVAGLKRGDGRNKPSWCAYSHFIGSNLCTYVPPGGFATQTSTTVTQIQNGAPGSASVSGNVYVTNMEGQPTNNVYVNVEFQKWENNAWVTKSTAQRTVSNNSYAVNNWSVDVGRWQVRAVLPTQGSYNGSASAYREFTITRIPTQTTVAVDLALHGQPGYASVSGNVTGGSTAINGAYVNVKFQKLINGAWTTMSTAQPTVSNGSYEVNHWRVDPGQWQVQAELPEQGNYAQSVSSAQPFQIKSGYRLVARHSEKCLSVSGNYRVNNQPLIQWDCSPNPITWDGQVFTLVPMEAGEQYFELMVNQYNEGGPRCVDVYGANPSDGGQLVLYDCIGAANQQWDIVPISGQYPYEALIARHSGKCMDVSGQSTANGAQIIQWGCYWGANQQWRWQAIE